MYRKAKDGVSVPAIFLSTRPWHCLKTKKEKFQSEQYVDQVLYSAMDGRQCQNKQHGGTVPKKAPRVFMFSTYQY